MLVGTDECVVLIAEGSMKRGVSSRKNKIDFTIGIVQKSNNLKINADTQTDTQTQIDERL